MSKGKWDGAGEEDLVLGLGRDLAGGLGSLGSLSAHVGTLGETTELHLMLAHVISMGLVWRDAYSLDDHTSDLIRVGVGGGPAVLEVALALLGASAVDTHRGATVGDAPGELVICSGLVAASHAGLVALTVDLHVLDVALAEGLHGLLDGFHATLLTHSLGGDIAVKTGAVPLAGNGLGVESHASTELFGNTMEQETRHPKLVTDCVHCQHVFKQKGDLSA
jgi:hypothetical protein